MGGRPLLVRLPQLHCLPNLVGAVRGRHPISHGWPWEPHDIAVLCQDVDAVVKVLADYEQTGTVQRPLVPRRYRKQVTELLEAVRTVESGRASPPLRLAVVIDWGKLDEDVMEDFKERGAAHGISPQEVLRRSAEEGMEIDGEVGGPVIVHTPDDEGTADADEEPET